MTVTSFRICVSDGVLNDLRIRLTRTRFTAASDPAFWAAGTDPGYLRELVTYWADGFDRILGRWFRPDTGPMVSTGYWADGFDRMAEQLCGNAAGRTAARRPELPHGPFTRRRVAELWHELMTRVLGYRRFGAFGGDIGGGVTQWLGALYPREVTGVHITSAVVTTDFTDQPPTAAEQAYLDARRLRRR